MVTNKIDAIKQVRYLNIKNPIAIEKDAVGRHYLSISCPLKDAKDLVEDIIAYADQSYYARNPFNEAREVPAVKTLFDWDVPTILLHLKERW